MTEFVDANGVTVELTPSDALVAWLMKRVATAGPDECWLWMGSRDRYGYGTFAGSKEKAHRWMYRAFVGELPSDYDIDHLCFNPPCVNPRHIRVLDRTENRRRQQDRHRARTKKPMCKRGHLFTPENTRITKRGNRICKACAVILRHESDKRTGNTAHQKRTHK